MSETQNSNANQPLTIFVWPSEWGLASLDAECLTALALLKFTGIEHVVKHVDNSFQLFKNTYPQIKHGDVTLTGLDEIINYVKKINNVNADLDDINLSDMLALLSLFQKKLIPAFLDLLWIDKENTFNVFRSAYGKHLRFPLSVVKLKFLSKDAENKLTSNYKQDYVKYDNLKTQILLDAKECLNIMSSKLDQGTFMFENRPSLIDTFIYGYLSIIYKASFVSSPLKSHLMACTNLCSYLNRIAVAYFPAAQEEIKEDCENESRENLNLTIREKPDLATCLHIFTQMVSLTVFFIVISRACK